MISASEARFRSKNQSKINKILESANRAIENAINAGKYGCYVTIDIDTEQDIINAVEKIFEENGYVVITPNYENQMCGAINKQQIHYKYIELYWGNGA